MTRSVTVHEAKTHLSRLLRAVEAGEDVEIRRGDTPVARLVPATPVEPIRRPRVGDVTTTGVRWTDDAFAPMTDEELADWGL